MSAITSAQLTTDAGTNINDNVLEEISPLDVRQRILDIADSFWNNTDNPQADAGELATLVETDVRLFSPADLQDAMHTLSDLDEDTQIEISRVADNDTIFFKAGGADIAEMTSTMALIGTASTGVKVETGTDLLTFDGGVLFTDYTSARNDGSTTKGFYLDVSGNLLYGTITASGGVAIQDVDGDTILTTEKTSDNDTLTLTIGANEYLSISTTLFEFGDFDAAGNGASLVINDTAETALLKADLGVTLQSGTGKTLLLDGTANKLILATGLDMQLVNYPNSRDDGSTTIAFYPDASGNIQVGSVSGAGAGGTNIADADGDTKIEVERTADDDIIYFKRAGTDVLQWDSTGLLINPGGNKLFIDSTDVVIGTSTDNFTFSPASSLIAGSLDSIDIFYYDINTFTVRARIGDVGAGGNSTYLDVFDANTRIDQYADGNLRFRVSDSDIYIGGTATNYTQFTTATGQTQFFVNSKVALDITEDKVELGDIAATGLLVDNSTGNKTITGYCQGRGWLEVEEIASKVQVNLGGFDDGGSATLLIVNTNANFIEMHETGTRYFDLDGGILQLGADDESINIDSNTETIAIAAGGIGVASFTSTAYKFGDHATSGNGSRLEVDDTAQTIKGILGTATLLTVGTAAVDLGNASIYVRSDITSDKIHIEAADVVFDQIKARTDTEQDYSLTLDGSGNLNRAKINSLDLISFAMSDETTDLVASTSVPVVTSHWAYKFRLEQIYIGLTTASTGAGITVDVHDAGTTIFSTKLTTDATEDSSHTATTPHVFTAGANHTFDKGDKMELFIDVIGSTIAGAGLKVYLVGTKIP